MRRIMVNTAIDAIRRRNAAGWVLGDEGSFEPVDDDGGWEMEEEEGAVYTVHDVLDAMEHLTPMYRTVFNLYVFDNLGHQEISDRLGISVEPEVELAKARRNLRDLLLTQKEKITMSSDHPFDKQMKTSFDGFEPNVHANWAEFERSLEPTSSAPSQSSSTLNRWAVATAVAAGGALMWVAKPVVQDLMVEDGTEVVVEMNDIEGEHPQTFDEAWEEFTNVTQGFVEDVMDAEAEAALLTEASEKDGSSAEADLPTSEQTSTALEQSTTPELDDVMVASVDVDATDTDAQDIDVDKLLAELPFDASVREACEGVEVAFELTGLDRTMSFLWNFGDGNFSSDPAPARV